MAYNLKVKSSVSALFCPDDEAISNCYISVLNSLAGTILVFCFINNLSILTQ